MAYYKRNKLAYGGGVIPNPLQQQPLAQSSTTGILPNTLQGIPAPRGVSGASSIGGANPAIANATSSLQQGVQPQAGVPAPVTGQEQTAQGISGAAQSIPVYGAIVGAGNKLSDAGVQMLGQNTRAGEAVQQGRPDRAIANLGARVKEGDVLGAGANILTGGASEFVAPLLGMKSPGRKKREAKEKAAENKRVATIGAQQAQAYQQNIAAQNPAQLTPTFAGGGDLNLQTPIDNPTIYGGGGTHEQNPNGGIPVGGNALVEEGEVRHGDYIFSNRLS